MPNKTTVYFPVRNRLIVAAIAACFVSASAWSNPTGPQVVNGSASFNQAGNLLTVTNSNGAIINWNTFSIGANETTLFNQPSTSKQRIEPRALQRPLGAARNAEFQRQGMADQSGRDHGRTGRDDRRGRLHREHAQCLEPGLPCRRG